MRRAWLPGLALLLALLAAAKATAVPEPLPFVGPWIVVTPGDPRIGGLARASPESLSPNAPGLLLDVPPSALADPGAATSARDLVADARQAGWRAGLLVDLPDTSVPTDPRAAEAVSPETLYPGLGRLLSAASGADLFVLGFPKLEEEDLPARRFVLRKVAASIRAANPAARIALIVHPGAGPGLFPGVTRDLLRDDVAAYVDLLGLHAETGLPAPKALRAAADALSEGRPLLLVAPPQREAASLLDLAARFAPQGVPAVAAPLEPDTSGDATLLRFGRLLAGDFGADARSAAAHTADGVPLAVYRFLPKSDLGGVVLVPGVGEGGVPYRGDVRLTLDAPVYKAFRVVELATGRTGRFDIPRTPGPPTLTFSTSQGPVAVVLEARDLSPAELQQAQVSATAVRGITAEEIIAKHQVWRAARDARWKRLAARDTTAYRIRLAELNQSMELTIAGAFFFEPGKGYDWAWEEAFFNGVRWPGKTVPKLPLLQPEKVSELPLELTFGDAYRYRLEGEDDVRGVPCWRLAFAPVAEFSEKPIYEGDVYISRADYSVIRVRARQRNLSGDVQSADETTDFDEVSPSAGGPAMRFPVHVAGQTIFRTFSRTTVIERDTRLTEVVLDPPDFEERRIRALTSNEVMVRDTEKGIRYLEKTKEGERRPADRPKSSQLFGLAGAYYDASLSFPLPLLGVYYIDLDVGKTGDQTQILFGGVLLAGSWNRTSLFGTKLEAGGDVFGIAVRGTDTTFQDGEKVEAEQVKTRSFGFNLNLAYPIVPHLKVAVAAGLGHRDFAEGDNASPEFAVPSSHWTYRLEGRLTLDVGGYSLAGRYGWSRRSRWDPWGYPGNPDYDPGKDVYRTWGVTLAKDFALPKFQRIQASATWAGTWNADRFSKLTFGSFGGNSLIGFSAGSLRAEQAVILRGSYGLMIGSLFRLSAEYDHALVWDAPSGYSATSFGGAGINGQLPGPWSTLIQLTTGLPVVGRDKGQKGFFLSFGILKFF
ncbi:MAG: hypothetical protein ACHQPI_07530 [Thermoanaerobaculia bacterium]